MKSMPKLIWILLATCIWLVPASMADEACEEAVMACLTEAIDEYSECVEACNIFDGRRWDVCTERCEVKTRRSETACEEESACSPRPADNHEDASTSPPRPMKAEGAGCYLGECPDDTPVETSAPKRHEPQTSPTGTAPQPQPYSTAPQMQLSWVCQTPQHWCMMNASPQALPVGSPCFCVNPIYGYANGVVIPMQ